MSAINAPAANQMVVRPTVAASTARKTTARANHMMVMLTVIPDIVINSFSFPPYANYTILIQPWLLLFFCPCVVHIVLDYTEEGRIEFTYLLLENIADFLLGQLTFVR